MDIYSLLALIFSLVYIALAIRNNKWCFPFAFIGSMVWAYADFNIYNLKFDGGLQIFYAIMAIAGWLKWSKDSKDRSSQKIQNISVINNGLIIGTGLITTFCLVQGLTHFTTTDLPYLDATTTVFSVFATFMLIYRKIDNWIYLLVCDVIYIYIYYIKDAFFFIAIMVIYSILAIVGYQSWLRMSRKYEVT